MKLSDFEFFAFDTQPDGVLTVTFPNPDDLNRVTEIGHRELAELWPVADRDPSVRVVLLRSEGHAFSAGGDYEMISNLVDDAAIHRRVMREARDLVRNMVEFSKPVVSAIQGPAVGAGLAAALLADIPVAARSAKIIDGHTSIGVAAGDHAAIIWPLLVGMAKAKFLLMTNEPVDGAEAERIGLVSKVVDDDELDEYTRSLAAQLARGSAEALSATKHTLNHWLRGAYPAFDASLAYEFLGFTSADAREGLEAAKEKRPPSFE